MAIKILFIHSAIERKSIIYIYIYIYMCVYNVNNDKIFVLNKIEWEKELIILHWFTVYNSL